MDVQPAWPDELVRVAMVVLSTYRIRLKDSHKRERAFILWVIASGRYVRAENYALYWFDDHGAWMIHDGAVPGKMSARVARLLRQVEEILFCLFPSLQVERMMILSTQWTYCFAIGDDIERYFQRRASCCSVCTLHR